MLCAPLRLLAAAPTLESSLTESAPLIRNDAVVFGMLMAILGFVFWSSNSQWSGFRLFYKFIPMLLMCYFLPALLTLFGIVDPAESNLYQVASRYLLPACLVLLTMSIDLREILRLGPRALIMFLTGTVGVVLGGPIAILLVGSVWPELVGGDGSSAVWRGLSTVAGSWIGGGANQVAMQTIFKPSPELFSVMVAVDVIIAEIWMFFLLLGVGQSEKIDKWLHADTSAITRLKEKMKLREESFSRIPTTTDLMVVSGIAFATVGVCHAAADILAPWIGEHYPGLQKLSLNSEFFWLIVLSTTFGVLFSFTRLREYESAGASKIGTLFIFILVATIGLNMDISALFYNPRLFVVGGVWMAFHVLLLVIVARLIRAPYFFLAVGSKANIGGAASAPVVAGAFHPSLAPVGVLLAVVGYALGTYCAWLCAMLMQAAAAAV
ncbi:hypothetical protein FF011L_53820 [Roseimaritima multifibrata]|uniref:DUF819 domain-containing protein n=1 Tax=Roseimaritima multifibrata TaxID=1930274 RepID=A0A517MNW3_9BACT|nr:DUF819 family protein [Roseimaritima multifibrata]QDS96570.1 hypothetical protein FF011L_53820 [Roseimaritima multifibrata]